MEKLQPKLRFPEFEGNWITTKMKDVSVKINSGKTPLGGETVYTNDGVLFIRSQNVNNNRLDLSNKTFISLEINNTMKNSVVKANDILLNITGASLGRSCVVPNDFEIGNVNQHVCIIRLNPNHNPRFYQPLFSSQKGQNLLQSLQVGGGREGLNFDSIKKMGVHVPSLSEQRKIASFLTTVDEKINGLKKQLSLLETYKKGVMQKIFSQELRFKDENGKNFPDWEEKKLGEIGDFQTSSIDKLSSPNEEEVFLVNYMNVYRHERINNETKKSLQKVTAKSSQILSCNLLKGDILFTPSSETPSDIGHSVVIFEDLKQTVYSYHLMRYRPKIKIDILYSHYFCNVPNVLKQISQLATGSTRFTISVKAFSSIILNLPSLPEQQKIASFLSTIDEKIEKCQGQIQSMEKWKKGLLQQMFV